MNFDGVEWAPFRTLDEFLLSESRFQIPDFNNMDKVANRIVNNLLYYQTNYFVASLLIFLLNIFLNPGQMIFGLLTMTAMFGLLYYLSATQDKLKKIKQNHPMMVMVSTFLVGYLLIYQIGCVVSFLLGVLMPVVFTLVHATLRMRNMKNKASGVKSAFWRKVSNIDTQELSC